MREILFRGKRFDNGKCKNIGINTLFLICRYGLDVSLSEFLSDISDCEIE